MRVVRCALMDLASTWRINTEITTMISGNNIKFMSFWVQHMAELDCLWLFWSLFLQVISWNWDCTTTVLCLIAQVWLCFVMWCHCEWLFFWLLSAFWCRRRAFISLMKSQLSKNVHAHCYLSICLFKHEMPYCYLQCSMRDQSY